MLSIVSFTIPSYASEDDPYDSGYDHGCDDAKIFDSSDRYINQPEKGPAFHTDRFMEGYNAGFSACAGSNLDDDDESEEFNSQGPAPLSSSDWTLRVDLIQTTFGIERATVTLKGPFGYQDTRSVQTGPSVSVTFSVPGSAIPSGYNYEVCVSGSILSAILPNCQFRPHGSGDESISMEIPG